MITKQKLDRINQCRHLLDATASQVVGELIDEIRRLTRENDRVRGVVRDFVEDYLNVSWGNDGDCGVTRRVNALECEINEPQKP